MKNIKQYAEIILWLYSRTIIIKNIAELFTVPGNQDVSTDDTALCYQ